MKRTIKRISKKFIIIIVVIMILLSSCIPARVFAEDDEEPAYEGLPKGGKFEAVTLTDWVVDSLDWLIDWFIGICTYIHRAVILGWTGAIESAISGVVSIGTATPIDGSITVEKIVSNRIPILDVNFFNLDTAGGEDLDEDSLIYLIRETIAQFYFIIRNITISGLLITLLYIGIRMAMSSVSSEKAKYKQMLLGWLESMVLVFFIHYIMVFIIAANEFLVDTISKTIGGEETLYDTIRSQSYVVQSSIGWPATIIYLMLIYLLLKFLFIYLRRFINTAILTFLAPVIAISFSIDKIKDGKSQSFSKWMKDYAANVILQSIHCLLYFTFVTLAFNVSGQSIYGVALAVLLIANIPNAEKTFKKIFSVEGEGAAPGGLDDKDNKPWTKLMVAAHVVPNAVKLNAKQLGLITKPVRKPLSKPVNAGISKVKNKVKENRINKIKDALESAKRDGSDTVNIKSTLLGRKKSYNVDKLIKDANENGYDSRQMAEHLHSNMETERKTRSSKRKAEFKRGIKNTKAVVGMAMSIPMLSEGPIEALAHFNKHRRKLKIKGYKNGTTSSGTVLDDIKNGALNTVADSGMALSIPAFAANPVLGIATFMAFSKLRGKTISGFEGNGESGQEKEPVTYTAPAGSQSKVRSLARFLVDMSTGGVAPMVRQLKNNLDKSKLEDLKRRLVQQYKTSNEMLKKDIDDEYENLLRTQGINKDEVDRVKKLASQMIRVNSFVQDELPKSVELESIEQMAEIDSTQGRTRNSRGGDSVVLKTDENTDIIHLALAMESYKSRGEETVASINGYKLDSTKYSTTSRSRNRNRNQNSNTSSTGFDAFKDFITQGGTLSEKSVLDKFNAENKTKYDSLNKLYDGEVRRVRKEDLQSGKYFMDKAQLDGLSTQEKEDKKLEKHLQMIIESADMSAKTAINKKGLEKEFTQLAKKLIANRKGKRPEDITNKEFERMLSMMSDEQVLDILSVAGTKNSAVIKGNIPTGYERLLGLMEKVKYNDYVVRQVSYDTTQAAAVSERIKTNRKRGVI